MLFLLEAWLNLPSFSISSEILVSYMNEQYSAFWHISKCSADRYLNLARTTQTGSTAVSPLCLSELRVMSVLV